MPAARNKKGQFLKGGSSPNPAGRPKVAGQVREMIRERTPEMVERLMKIVNEGKPHDAIEACRLLLAHSLGQPPAAHLVQHLDASSALPGSLRVMPDGSMRPMSGVIFLPARPVDDDARETHAPVDTDILTVGYLPVPTANENLVSPSVSTDEVREADIPRTNFGGIWPHRRK